MNIKLLPCPFCGSIDIIVESYGVYTYRGSDKQDADVECNNCRASVPYTSYDTMNDSCSEGAIRKWNKRAIV